MTESINHLRLKLRNTKKLKRQSLTFSQMEVQELDDEITALEKKVKRLEAELLQQQTLSIDIIGQDF